MNGHWVPEFYLKGFVNPRYGRLTVFDKKTEFVSYKSTSDLCSEQDFFALDGTEEASQYFAIPIDKYILESEAGKNEKIAADILQSIRKNNSFDNVTKDDVRFLLEWMTWLMAANPDTQQIPIMNNPLNTKTQRNTAFIDWHTRMKPIVINKTWELLSCENSFLITSDRPVSVNKSLKSPKDVVNLSNSMIIFPLSPNLILIGVPNDKRGFFVIKEPRKIDYQDVVFFNQITFDNARQLVLATDKATLEIALNQLTRRNSSEEF